MTDPTGSHEPKNPVRYAEQVLQVHAAHEDALAHVAALEVAVNDATEASARVRAARESLADREAVVAVEGRNEFPDMAQGTFEKHLKNRVQQDDKAKQSRTDLYAAQHDLDAAEGRIKVADTRAKIAVARLEELGGLLVFYAHRSRPPHSPNTPNGDKHE